MNESADSSIFVVGAARSGTTLLYHILLASNEFAVYDAETWLLEKGKSRYGRLARDADRKRFLDDWIDSGQFKRSGLSASDYREQVRDRKMSLPELLEHFMRSVAGAQGKPRWAEKTPNHVFHMADIKTGIPDAKFIHIVRDGRSVAASIRKVGWSGTRSVKPLTQLAWAAKAWDYAVRHGIRAAKSMKDDCLQVKYEEIVTNLPRALGRINEFLGTSIQESDVAASGFGALGKSNTAFGEQTGGVHAQALKRWQTDLSPEENEVLVRLIGPTLKALGYQVSNAPTALPLYLHLKAMWWNAICPLAFATRRFVKNNTPLGRYLTTGYEEFTDYAHD